MHNTFDVCGKLVAGEHTSAMRQSDSCLQLVSRAEASSSCRPDM